jgi:hypothetical protein
LRLRSSGAILQPSSAFGKRGRVGTAANMDCASVRRRIGNSLMRLVALWLLPVAGVVVVAFEITRRG